jgi:hypothetical protein
MSTPEFTSLARTGNHTPFPGRTRLDLSGCRWLGPMTARRYNRGVSFYLCAFGGQIPSRELGVAHEVTPRATTGRMTALCGLCSTLLQLQQSIARAGGGPHRGPRGWALSSARRGQAGFAPHPILHRRTQRPAQRPGPTTNASDCHADTVPQRRLGPAHSRCWRAAVTASNSRTVWSAAALWWAANTVGRGPGRPRGQ